jgi:signal transduction histidine kinase
LKDVVFGTLLAKISRMARDQKEKNNILQQKEKEVETLNLELEKKVYEKTKEANQNLLFAENIFNALDSIVVLTNGHEIKKVNRAFLEFFDKYHALEEFKKDHSCICDLFIQEKGYLLKEKDGTPWTQHILQNPDILHKVIIKKDDKKYYFKVNAKRLPFNDKEDIITTFENITKLIEYEIDLQSKVEDGISQLRDKDEVIYQQARFVAMGEVMYLISHHWKQPLSALSLMVQDSVDAYDFGEIDKEYLEKFQEKSLKIIESMSKTIDTFKSIFSKEEMEEREFLLKDALEQAFFITKPVIGLKNIHIHRVCKDEHAKAVGFFKEYIQVITNIIYNAIDVLEEKTQDKQILITVDSTKDGKSVLEIFDNGKQIEENILEKIFDPYFSTKKNENGTGLGLFVCKSMIENHMNGKIEVQNKDDGVVFRIIV